MSFCRNCGAEMAADAKFCLSCGAPAAKPEQPEQPAQPVQPEQPVYQQPVYQQPVYQQPVYQQPVKQPKVKVPGRGMGISSLILSIIGLVLSSTFFFITLGIFEWSVLTGDNYVSYTSYQYYYYGSYQYKYPYTYSYNLFDESVAIGMLVMCAVFAILSILALPFAMSAKKRGYIAGPSKSGLTMSIIGLILWSFPIVLWIVGLACN